MKKTAIIVLAALLVFSINLFAQQKGAAISFEKEAHDFGTVQEENGSVTYKFVFTNTGDAPLTVQKVKASCGCTTPDWTKEAVPPGGKGFVAATYNPQNRPGKFNKSITVTSDAVTPTVVLRISGEVTPKPRTVADDYPKDMGDLRLKSNHISFVKIKNTQTLTESLDVMNGSADKPVKISFTELPDHITLKAIPETLKPGEKGVIEATFNAPKKKDWGFVIDRVPVLINGNNDPRNRLSVSATIEEDFSKLTPQQLADAPSIEFESTTFNFGTLKQGETADYEFKFKNTGKNDLIIRKTKASCGCTAVAPITEPIKGGASSSIKVTFNSTGKRGKQNKTITVVTNDPHDEGRKSSIVLRVTGEVEETENK